MLHQTYGKTYQERQVVVYQAFTLPTPLNPLTPKHSGYMKQTILVTGGTGFIGSHTTVELIEAGYNVVIVDNLSNSKIEVLDGIEKITGIRPAFEQIDLRDKEAAESVF